MEAPMDSATMQHMIFDLTQKLQNNSGNSSNQTSAAALTKALNDQLHQTKQEVWKLIRSNSKLNKTITAKDLELKVEPAAVELQCEYIGGLTNELGQKDQLLAQKDLELEAQRTKHKDQLNQLKASYADEVTRRQKEALSEMEIKLQLAQEQLQRADQHNQQDQKEIQRLSVELKKLQVQDKFQRLPLPALTISPSRTTSSKRKAVQHKGTQTPTVSPPAPVVEHVVTQLVSIPEELKVQLWEWERLLPPSKFLFDTYESQRELFFLLERLNLCQLLATSTFQKLWSEAAVTHTQPLLAEIIARGHLVIGDLVPLLPLVGDFEAKSLRYYSELEAELHQRRTVQPTPGVLELEYPLYSVIYLKSVML